MTSRPPFATVADLQARHPAELAVLAADEETRELDPVRVERALDDVSTEIRGILQSRYTADELDRLEPDSAGLLRLFAMDMALYRVALPPRQTEALRDRYGMAVKRLEAVAKGVGKLAVVGAGGGPAVPGADVAGSPNEVIIDAPERLFTRRRFRAIG